MTKWEQLLDVYDEVAADPAWKHLRKPGIQLVRGDGPGTAELARVLVVGEAPGALENGSGKPFVGPSGVMLGRLLEVAGLKRTEVFITNVVKYRPPGNRSPSGHEIKDGRKALRAEWKVIRPTLTIAVGSIAVDALMTPPEARQNHGRPVPWREDSYIAAMYHPAFGLRSSTARKWIEEEWQRLGHILRGSLNPKRWRLLS